MLAALEVNADAQAESQLLLWQLPPCLNDDRLGASTRGAWVHISRPGLSAVQGVCVRTTTCCVSRHGLRLEEGPCVPAPACATLH